MNLFSIDEIKNILNKHNVRPSKGLGQNFLIDRNILQKIIQAAELKPNDTVLEIGPGIGTLTQELAKYSKKVIAVEKDKKMAEIMKKIIVGENPTIVGFSPTIGNVKIINSDILKIKNLKIKNYKIISNLPYYISSPVIRKFLENPPNNKQPEFMILMLQKEVAQRICSKPPNMSLLSVSVQFYAKLEIIGYVSKNCFWPSPKVDSAIIKITPSKIVGDPTSRNFFKIVKAGFSQPRKQLANNLSKNLNLNKKEVETWLLKNKINPTKRAETLNIEDWKNLTNSI